MAQDLYSIRIYDRDRSLNLAKIRNFASMNFEKALNSHGIAQMNIGLLSPEATASNLKKYNRISIFKGASEKWRGYIKNARVDERFNVIVEMADMLFFLKEKRFITKTYPSQSVVTTFEDIIDTINAADPTGITFGGSDITSPPSEEFDFDNTAGFNALQDVAMSVAAEVYIDNDDKIWLLSQVGSDRTDTVQFKFLQNKMNENNTSGVIMMEDGNRLANYIIAKNNEGPPKTSVKSDSASIASYGRLEKVITFPDITSQNALDEATQDYLDTFSEQIISPSFRPISARIDESLYSIGDLCKIKMSYGYLSIDADYRIIRKGISVMKDGTNENVMVEVSNTKITKDNFFLRFSSVEKRLADLEK